MKSKYGIPGTILVDLRRRDQNCVYCRIPMPDWKDRENGLHYATIEHLYPPADDPTWVSWCCNGCNIRHQKPLREWFKSREINESTVAPIIKTFLASGLKESDQLWLDGREHRFLQSAPWKETSKGGEKSCQRDTLSDRDAKSFDCVVAAIAKRRYTFDFRGMKHGTFGRYYGHMYWLEDGHLRRIQFPD